MNAYSIFSLFNFPITDVHCSHNMLLFFEGGLGGWKKSRVDFLNLIFNQYFSFSEFDF